MKPFPFLDAAPPGVDVHVERLMLSGLDLDAGARRRMGDAFTAELTTLLAAGPDNASRPRSLVIRHLRLALPAAAPSADPRLLGRQIAQALFRRLSQ